MVELTVSEDNDYGMGSGELKMHIPYHALICFAAYWKDSRSHDNSGDLNFPVKSQMQGKSKGIPVPLEDSDEDENQFPVRPIGKRTTQSQKLPRVTKKKAPSPEEEGNFQPLFLSDDDDNDRMTVDEEEDIDLDEGTPTLRSSRTSNKSNQQSQVSKPRNKAAAPIIIEDDSDDDVTFKGFGAKAKARSRR